MTQFYSQGSEDKNIDFSLELADACDTKVASFNSYIISYIPVNVVKIKFCCFGDYLEQTDIPPALSVAVWHEEWRTSKYIINEMTWWNPNMGKGKIVEIKLLNIHNDGNFQPVIEHNNEVHSHNKKKVTSWHCTHRSFSNLALFSGASKSVTNDSKTDIVFSTLISRWAQRASIHIPEIAQWIYCFMVLSLTLVLLW